MDVKMNQEKKNTIDAILLKKIKNKRKITPSFHLIKDLCLDSMDMMEVVAMIEDELDIIIPINHLYNVRLVGDLYQLIEKLIMATEV
jgi:acyl carrier protein